MTLPNVVLSFIAILCSMGIRANVKRILDLLPTISLPASFRDIPDEARIERRTKDSSVDEHTQREAIVLSVYNFFLLLFF